MSDFTKEDLEEMARTIYAAAPAISFVEGIEMPVIWEDAAPPYKDEAFISAQAALTSPPVQRLRDENQKLLEIVVAIQTVLKRPATRIAEIEYISRLMDEILSPKDKP